MIKIKHKDNNLNFKSRLIKYEQYFCQNNYNGDIKSKDSFKYKEGNIPILFSAPHAVKHLRSGKIKPADVYTGLLVRLIGDLYNCHTIYKIKNDGTDPNYDNINEDGRYKKHLLNMIDNKDIKLFIDIHGASKEREFDVDMGTNNGTVLNDFKTIPKTIRLISYKHGLTDIGHNKVFKASTPNNITNNVGNLDKIPAIQLEINRKYRDFYEYPENQYKLVCALIEIIKYYKDFNWGNISKEVIK